VLPNTKNKAINSSKKRNKLFAPTTKAHQIRFKSKEFIALLGTKFEVSALAVLAHKIDEIIDRLNSLETK
jgi:hypothetical protein